VSTIKKAFIFFLVFLIVLLTGCSSDSRYPKDKAAMKTLFEDNAEEFQKFADNLLLQVEEGEILDIVYVPRANLGSVFGYTIRKGTNGSALESISKLQNGKEISDFFTKYSVFTAIVGGGSRDVTFHIFPIHLAETSGSGSGYKPEHMNDIRAYFYLSNPSEEEISGMLSRGILEIKDHWYASIPGQETTQNDTKRTLAMVKSQLIADGYKEIDPITTSINLPFLADREKVSDKGNSYADYLFEIDETHMLFFYERKKKVSATLFNWKTEEIVGTYAFPVEASQSGIYHVEQISPDLFAYSEANVSGVPQLINILRITPDEIAEVGIVTLPTDVKFTVCSVAISPDMKQIVMARSDPARLTLAELDDSLALHETGELNAALLMIGDRATIDNVKFISEDVVAYSWTANNTDDAARYSGIGLYSISEKKILLDYPFKNDGMIQVGNGVIVSDEDVYNKEDLSGLVRYITQDEIVVFGEETFAFRYQHYITSYLSNQMFTFVDGKPEGDEPLCYVRFSLIDKAWDKELWNVPDPKFQRNDPTKTRPLLISTAGIYSKRFYVIALVDQKPVLNVVQHPNP